MAQRRRFWRSASGPLEIAAITENLDSVFGQRCESWYTKRLIASFHHRSSNECKFDFRTFRRCAGCFEFVNRTRLSRSPKGPCGGPQTIKAADDRQDRKTAFTPPADLSLDPDDGAVHRPPCHRRCHVFRHPAAGVVADISG